MSRTTTTRTPVSRPLHEDHAPRTPRPGNRSAGNILRTALRAPFTARTWGSYAYLLLAVPAALLTVPLALVGGPAGRLQQRLARTLLRLEPDGARPTAVRALAHALLALPVGTAGIVVLAYTASLIPLNLLWPLRSLVGMDADPAHSWGGPTTAGAWAVHALAGGVPFLLLTPWIARGFTALHTRLLTGVLGGRGSVRAVLPALGVTAVCALFSVPIVHQL